MKWGGSRSWARRVRPRRPWLDWRYAGPDWAHPSATGRFPWDYIIAFHEATHFVLCMRLRVGVGEVSIEGDEGAAGRTWVTKVVRIGPKRAEARIMVLLGAGEATARLTGRYDERETRADRHRALEIAKMVFEDSKDAKAYVSELRARVRRLVATPGCWGAIECLAQELVQRRSLSGRQARRIVLAYDQCHGHAREADFHTSKGGRVSEPDSLPAAAQPHSASTLRSLLVALGVAGIAGLTGRLMAAVLRKHEH